MPFNGSGVFNRIYSWVQDAANGIDVSSTRTDTDTNDIAANGLSNCITRDGQTTVLANIPLSGFKITGLGLGTTATDSARIDNANAYSTCEFRLTLTTGVPVTTADVTAATTLYCCPYKGQNIALYDGTNWHMRNSTQFSIAVPATMNTLYDVYCYDNSGVPTLELLAWTNDTSRATALTTQNGVYVKTGATTRRYLGSFRTTGSSGQTEDSAAKRWVWNYYNRVVRPMQVLESTASWNYTTATIRQANGATANQLDFVVGVLEDTISARVRVYVSNASAGIAIFCGIGPDSTTGTGSGLMRWDSNQVTLVAGKAQLSTADFNNSGNQISAAGRHFLAWLELSAASGTTTWYSAGFSGIQGEILG